MHETLSMPQLLVRIRKCRHCEKSLPLGPRPVVRADTSARLLIVGQAPGLRVHKSGIPWDDASGERLRDWLQIDKAHFYDESRVAIMPMGFCYPGTGKSGDLPPEPDCAPLWHEPLLKHMPDIRLTLLIGRYAQAYYLDDPKETLSARVERWRDFGPQILPLPHPSPRNNLWLRKHPWFEAEVLPDLRRRLRRLWS
ncbi:MAG: uracil-DNA glycosylase family protein [Parahaliea sp.]